MRQRTIGNTDDVSAISSGVQTWGNTDTFILISKAFNEKEKSFKSTKAMYTGNGVMIQVTTNEAGNVAEALEFVRGVIIAERVVDNKVTERAICMGVGQKMKEKGWRQVKPYFFEDDE